MIFPNLSIDAKLRFLSVGFRLHFQVVSNSQKDFAVLNVTLAELLSFSQFMIKMESCFFENKLGLFSKTIFPIY